MTHKILPSHISAKTIENLLKIKEKKLLVYHRDADGICSAALILRFFSGFETIPRHGPKIETKFMKEIIKKKPKLLVFIDIPADQEWKKLEKIKKTIPGIKILIIDHHIPTKNLNFKRIIHINPRFYKDVYISASYVVYRLLEYMGKKVKPLIWIAVVGAIGDYDLSESEKILEECEREFPGLIGQEPLKGTLGYASELICAAVTVKDLEGAEKVLKILVHAKDYKDFFKSRCIKTWHRMVREEIYKVTKEAKIERYPELNLRIYTIKTKMNLTSAISTIFGERYPEDLVLVKKKTENEWKISFRNQSGKINTGELANKCAKGIGLGGGHKKAAGALIKDWRVFKKRLIQELKNQTN